MAEAVRDDGDRKEDEEKEFGSQAGRPTKQRHIVSDCCCVHSPHLFFEMGSVLESRLLRCREVARFTLLRLSFAQYIMTVFVVFFKSISVFRPPHRPPARSSPGAPTAPLLVSQNGRSPPDCRNALVGGGGCHACMHTQDISLLWEDEGVQAAYGERHRYWLLDAAAYYFDNVER